jgi:GH25 family lysozyme M1 (1,4-beta-N-acetylmuramidase)
MIDRSVLGTDLSYNQGPVDFVMAEANGVQFAGIRCTQFPWIDPRFKDNWRMSRGIIPRFPYVVYSPGGRGIDQADLFLGQFANRDYGELNTALDLELFPVDWDQLYIMVQDIEREIGREIMGYTGAWVLNQLKVPEWFRRKPHWLTGYNEIGPTMPSAYIPSVVCWQQSESWKVPWVGM